MQKDDGKTPLEIAIEKKQDSAVHLLTQYLNNKA